MTTLQAFDLSRFPVLGYTEYEGEWPDPGSQRHALGDPERAALRQKLRLQFDLVQTVRRLQKRRRRSGSGQ